MRSIAIIVGGLLLFGLFVLVAGRMGASGVSSIVTAAKIFIPIWLVVALVNLWMGVARAGYSVAEEAPIFVAIFAIPAAVAAFVWWKYS
jgi:hypothetical protein